MKQSFHSSISKNDRTSMVINDEESIQDTSINEIKKFQIKVNISKKNTQIYGSYLKYFGIFLILLSIFLII
jgi:hypothetical protein